MALNRPIGISEGLTWFVASDVIFQFPNEEVIEVSPASIIIPIDQIKNLSDEAIGRNVRRLISPAKHIAAYEIAHHIIKFKNDLFGVSDEALNYYLSWFAEFKMDSDICEALEIIYEAHRENELRVQKAEKRKKALEKRQKAKSYIYLITDKKHIKIGITDDVERRLKSLQTGNPYKLSIIYKKQVKNPSKIEAVIHKHFNNKQVNNEWFTLTNHDIQVILRFLRKLEIE